MIRRVAFPKAIAAGAAGALAWELAVRVWIALGQHPFDIVHTLGTLPPIDASPALWWPLGMALHAFTGGIWAIFYAYFFWATFRLPPPIQGLLFSLLPALLAGFFMVPELGHMHRSAEPGLFATRLGVIGPLSIFAGHAIYGLVAGAIYVRPVGERVHA